MPPARSALFLLCALLFLPACQSMQRRAEWRSPAPPQNYFHPETEGIQIRRVAVLPFHDERTGPQQLSNIESAFRAELTKSAFFEIVPIGRTELEAITGQGQLPSTSLIPAGLLAELRRRHGVDGVIFTDLTHFFPYRPVSLGVRSKLVDVGTGEIRWAYDCLFDSGNAAIAKDARDFQKLTSAPGYPFATDSDIVLQSPTRFAHYAANRTYHSLQDAPDPASNQ